MMSGVKKKEKIKKNKESGMSLVESLPLIVVLASLVGFLLGLWGMTHKHVLHSIAARNYAFETFRNRANLMYFGSGGPTHTYEQSEMRFHAVAESSNGSGLKAFTTPIRVPAQNVQNDPVSTHREKIWEDAQIPRIGEAQLEANLPWVLVGYGICLNSRCGGGE